MKWEAPVGDRVAEIEHFVPRRTASGRGELEWELLGVKELHEGAGMVFLCQVATPGWALKWGDGAKLPNKQEIKSVPCYSVIFTWSSCKILLFFCLFDSDITINLVGGEKLELSCCLHQANTKYINTLPSFWNATLLHFFSKLCFSWPHGLHFTHSQYPIYFYFAMEKSVQFQMGFLCFLTDLASSQPDLLICNSFHVKAAIPFDVCSVKNQKLSNNSREFAK